MIAQKLYVQKDLTMLATVAWTFTSGPREAGASGSLWV